MKTTKNIFLVLALVAVLLFCSVGAFAAEETEPALVGYQLNLGDDLTLRMFVEAQSNTVVEVSVAGKTTSYDLSTMTPDENGRYVIAAHMAATQMTETITLNFMQGGVSVSQKTYTIRQYALEILQGDYPDKTKAMVQQMLNYGAAAQQYFGVNTEKLANADYEITEEVTLPAEYEATVVSGSIDGMQFYGASLVCGNKLALRYYFTGSVDGVSYGDYEVIEKNGMHYVEVPGINPQDYAKSITLTATKGEDKLSVSYSPLYYIIRMSEKGDPKLKTLLNALYGYHAAAVEYVNNAGFFGGAYGYVTDSQMNLSADTGANKGTVNVANNGISFGYIQNFREENFYFEAKFHANDVLETENWPKFGLFVQGENVQDAFYVDMNRERNASVVGRTESIDGTFDWENTKTARVDNMAFSAEGEKVTLGILKDGKRLHMFVNDSYILSTVCGFDGSALAGIFSFNTGLTVTEYFTDLTDETMAAKKALIPEGELTKGEVFGYVVGDEVLYGTSNGINLTGDHGDKAFISIHGGAPQYAYLNDVYTNKFCFETEINVAEVLNDDAYPKFGIMVNGASEMVKFFVDMTPAMTATHVGVVYQPTGGGDDWAGAKSVEVPGMSFTGSDTVKMKLVRDGRDYYLYVNDELVLYNAEGFKAEKGAVGIFSFNAVMTASKYSYAVGGAADSAIQKAKEDLDAREEVPGTAAPKQMLQSNNQGKIDFVELGKKIWTDKDYVFISMPEAFVGKEFVKASYGAENQTVDVTVQKSGYVYVLTNTYKTSNSQAETLDGMNYTKLDMAGWKFCDFTGSSSYIWVYEKYVEAGETLKLGQWSVVIASESRLNLDSDSSKAADSSMAVLKPAEGASVGNMELGAKAFADKNYTFEEMPYWLAGKNYILGNYGKGSATAVRGGYVYMLTNTGNSGKRVSYLESNGYTKVNVPAFTAFTGGSFGDYEFVVYRKSIAENETVSWPSWAIPVFSGDLVLSDNMAKIAPDGTTTKAARYDQNVRLFDNRTYYASGDPLTALHGKSYLYSGFEEGATGTVTEAGTVYVQIPVRNSNESYKQLEADLIAAGYTPVPYRLFRNNKGLPGKSLGYAQKLYQKEVEVGETVHFGQYNLVYFDTLSEEEYYVMPSVTIPAYIVNNPKVYGPSDDLYTYDPSDRNWQGCPVITTTKGPNGGTRMWAAWFTGGEDELGKGNMAVLLYSDDNGQTWVDPAVAIVHPDVTASVTKPQLWTLDDGTLWVSWTQHTVVGNAVGFDGRMGTWAAVCKNPWASMDEWQWTTPTRLFEGRGNGKITVLNRGLANEEWLTTAFDWIDRNYSKVYSSTDRGQTWTFKGKAEVVGSTYNNAILTEQTDSEGNSYLWMLLRQLEGNMKESFSYDGGKTWTNATVSNIAHPNSAIYVGWTSSGKLLMINHKDFSGRNNLTAFLSEDGGKTWPHTLLLDARSGVSYPDVIEDNGTFYVVYDYDRFNTGRMYMAKITEADIKAGQLVSDGSYLKHQFSSMGIHGPQVNEGVQKINLSGMEATASSTGSPAWDAFDSNADTRWCATNETVPQWLMIDLKNVYDLDAVYMFFEQKSNWDYKVEVSVDGKEWNVYSDPAAQKIIDVTINQQAKARYVRLTVESTTGGAWASVWEMELYGKLAEPEIATTDDLDPNPNPDPDPVAE